MIIVVRGLAVVVVVVVVLGVVVWRKRRMSSMNFHQKTEKERKKMERFKDPSPPWS